MRREYVVENNNSSRKGASIDLSAALSSKQHAKSSNNLKWFISLKAPLFLLFLLHASFVVKRERQVRTYQQYAFLYVDHSESPVVPPFSVTCAFVGWREILQRSYWRDAFTDFPIIHELFTRSLCAMADISMFILDFIIAELENSANCQWTRGRSFGVQLGRNLKFVSVGYTYLLMLTYSFLNFIG